MTENDERVVFTIGHSTLSYVGFLSLLEAAGVTAVADVRSTPQSRLFPHFCHDALRKSLKNDGIAYVFLGKELGGRPRGKNFFRNGVADYEKMAQTSHFKEGIQRIFDGHHRHRIALMCSEHNPLDCHRCLLVARQLKRMQIKVRNILGDGKQLSQEQVEESLLSMAGYAADDFFTNRDERISMAYQARSEKIAFPEPQSKD